MVTFYTSQGDGHHPRAMLEHVQRGVDDFVLILALVLLILYACGTPPRFNR